MTHQISTAAIIVVTLFFGLFAGHFFRWNVIPWLIDARGDAHTVARYIYGTAWIWFGVTAWVLINADRIQPIDTVIIFWVMACAAGAGTCAGYLVDLIIERRIKRQTGKHDGAHD